MKKLIFLQCLGVAVFGFIVLMLNFFGIFNIFSVILVYAVMGICNIVNARSILLKPIERVSTHDRLTGCYNRVKLDMRAEDYSNSEYSVIFFDVNNLKKMNDTHGHDDGDRLLIRASNQLRFWSDYGDLYRIGGDEFIVVIQNMNPLRLETLLHDWYGKLPSLNRDYPDDFICDFSFGIGTKKNGMTFEETVNEAAEKMYQMKTKIKGL